MVHGLPDHERTCRSSCSCHSNPNIKKNHIISTQHSPRCSNTRPLSGCCGIFSSCAQFPAAPEQCADPLYDMQATVHKQMSQGQGLQIQAVRIGILMDV